MKGILTLAAITLMGTASAQNYGPTELTEIGKEPPRTSFIVYPTAQEAATCSHEASKYLTPLTEWTKQTTDTGTEFSTQFTVPFAWVNRQVLLHIGWASADYEVRLNGKKVGYCLNGSAPVDYNLTKQAAEGVNKLTVTILSKPISAPLESYRKPTTPTLGECYVMSQPTIRIRDIFTRTRKVADNYNAEIGIVVKTDALNPKTAKIHYELITPDTTVATYGSEAITLDMRREDTIRIVATIPDTMLWSLRRPTLYTLNLKTQTEGRYTEYTTFKVGFRQVDNIMNQLAVNGMGVDLKAIPLGESISASKLREWKKHGYNLLFLPPGGVARELYDLCDQIGIYIVEQASIDTSASGPSIRKGGNPSNDPAWGDAFIGRIEDSYHTSQLHPSVVVFSIANESANGINLYEGYLRLKSLEPDRPIIYPDAEGQWNTDVVLLPE